MFKIGDVIWVPDCGNKQKQVTCPICFGKLRVTLILGNGENVSLPCDYCGKGYEGPRGYVEEHDYVVEATPHTVTGKRSTMTKDGEAVEYHVGSDTCYRIFKPEDCFATREEAQKAAIAKKAQLDREQNERSEYLKHDQRKSYSWNAGYHLRAVKKAQQDIEYHSKMAQLCKEKARKEV